MLPPGCEERCPGCAHRGYDAHQSEALKYNWLKKTLFPWREQLESLRSVQDEARWGYREKTCLAAEWKNGVWNFGMKIPAPNWATEIIPIPGCPVHSPRIQTILKLLSRRLPHDGFPLHYIAITGALLTFVVKTKALDTATEALLKKAVSDLPFEGVWLNANPSTGKRIFSSSGWKLLLGNATARSGKLIHGPESFQQLIPSLYDDALREAQSFLHGGASDLVLDLYSGLGASVSRWIAQGSESIGVELLGEAVKCAALNNPDKVRFFQGKVSERIVQLEEEVGKWRLRNPEGSLFVFTNPPRTGMEEPVLEWLLERANPRRIAYLSCSAGTLGRDLSVLSAYGVRRIIPYDFFPQTLHVETLACLELDTARSLGHPAAL